MLEEYVTTTVTDVMSNFFGSQFSEQSTAVKVTVDIFVGAVLLYQSLASTRQCLESSEGLCLVW